MSSLCETEHHGTVPPITSNHCVYPVAIGIQSAVAECWFNNPAPVSIEWFSFLVGGRPAASHHMSHFAFAGQPVQVARSVVVICPGPGPAVLVIGLGFWYFFCGFRFGFGDLSKPVPIRMKLCVRNKWPRSVVDVMWCDNRVYSLFCFAFDFSISGCDSVRTTDSTAGFS